MSRFFIGRPIVAIVIAIVTVIAGSSRWGDFLSRSFPTSFRRRSSSRRPTRERTR